MKSRIAIAIAVLTLFAAGCSNSPEGSGENSEGEARLSYAYQVDSPNLADIYLSIAQDKGLFKELGLKVDYKFLNGAGPAFQALIANETDLSQVGVDQFYKAVQSGEELEAVLDLTPTSQYYLLTNDSIKNWNDLEDARIGISQPGTLSQSIVQLAMEANGADPDKAKYLAVGGSGARRQSLVSGRIDAGVGHASDAVALSGEGIKPFANLDEELPKLQGVMTVAKSDTVDKKRTAIVKFSAALIQGARMAAADKDLAVAEFVKHRKGTNKEDAATAYELLHDTAWNLNGGMEKERYEYTAQTLIDAGTLKSPPPDYSSLFDVKIQEEAIQLADKTWGGSS